jgi:hypothetical protein
MANNLTAVECLYERLERMIPRTALYDIEKIEYFQQAKEMEKQHIIDAYQQGFNNAYFSNPLSKEQYYNETFNK